MEICRYDELALKDIDRFKNPPRTLLNRVREVIADPMEKVSDFVCDNAVGIAVIKAISGIVDLLNDGASWSVRTGAILEEFRKGGHQGVRALPFIRGLSLEEVDQTVGMLAAKYKALAFAEGAGTGALGAPGIAIDIPALVSFALRAVNEYATYYGFDLRAQSERMVVMQVLSAASSPTVAAKQLALAQITKISVMIAKKKTWEELQRLPCLPG